VPSNTNLLTPWLTATWILWICWAITDNTYTHIDMGKSVSLKFDFVQIFMQVGPKISGYNKYIHVHEISVLENLNGTYIRMSNFRAYCS
jgi:hypothetical protein